MRVSTVPSARRELLVVGGTYLGYEVSRVLASDNLRSAAHRARMIGWLERGLSLRWERVTNLWFAHHDLVGLVAAYWYSTAHYVVTLAMLLWLFRRRPEVYLRARRALVGATAVALVMYLLLPTAPPRLVDGYVDVLAMHSGAGWWGGDASAPRGLGGMTNVLAAFPSMHAGWSLWVALVIQATTAARGPRLTGWLYAAATATVVVGTGNHWVLDVLAGWAVTTASWVALARGVGWAAPTRGVGDAAAAPYLNDR